MKAPLTDMSSSETNKATTSAVSNPSTPDTKKQERSSIIELKNGKVVCKQKCISFEKQSETLQEIVKFREMLEDRIEKQWPPLDAIPDEHQPLIAKLAHESDKTLGALTKHIHHELLPTQDEDEETQKVSSATFALPLKVVESTIKLILVRNNYGLDFGNAKPPAAVSVWRWEVKDKYRKWLPKNGREKAEARLAERVRAKQDLKLVFDALPQAERDKIFDPIKIGKIPPKEFDIHTTSELEKLEQQPGELLKPSPQQPKKQAKQKSEDVENDATTDSVTPRVSRSKKVLDPEKAAKEKERLEKKAAKVEKDKKEKDAQSKSRSIMANFFAKPKASTSSRAPSNEAESAIAGPSQVHSEFSKSFKPFVLKKDTTLAPINWFVRNKKQKRQHLSSAHTNEVITIDCDDEDEEVGMQSCQSTIGQADLSTMSARDRLDSILSTLPPSAEPSQLPSLRNRFTQFKTHNPVAVRNIVSQLSEAEIIGDDALVRCLLDKLRDRSILPAKVFIFTEDARPGYFGTWSRSSRIIGPRTPLAKDVLVFDYGYDSGEEWEDEAAGDADDVADDGEDEDPENDDVDSDLESWLVDDEEEPMSLDARESTPPEVDFTTHSNKRKADDGERRLGKKRKVVVPLIPFVKGPCWESTIGVCAYDPFKSYRLQLFNDTPFPIDPFTFESSCIEDQQSSAAPASTTSVFLMPSLPSRLTAPNNTTSFIDCTPSAFLPGPSVTAPKKAAPTPKTPFPDTHVPFLLDKITQLQASSFVLLVEAIYHELRAHKVTKISIEAKVKEVGEKCKEKKIWVVKPTLLVAQA